MRNGLTREEVITFVGPRADFYMDKWRLHAGRSFKGWNWAGFFFGFEWMLYRKMYAECFIGYGIILSLSVLSILLQQVFRFSLPGLGLLGDTLRILIGAFGNMFYRNKAMRVANAVKAPDEATLLAEMKRRGGTSITAVILLVGIEIGLIALRLFI